MCQDQDSVVTGVRQPLSLTCVNTFCTNLICLVCSLCVFIHIFVWSYGTLFVDLLCLSHYNMAEKLGEQVYDSFTLHNGLFAKRLCCLGTGEAQSPKCLMLCSSTIWQCFTTLAVSLHPAALGAFHNGSITTSFCKWIAKDLWGRVFNTGVTPLQG